MIGRMAMYVTIGGVCLLSHVAARKQCQPCVDGWHRESCNEHRA